MQEKNKHSNTRIKQHYKTPSFPFIPSPLTLLRLAWIRLGDLLDTVGGFGWGTVKVDATVPGDHFGEDIKNRLW